MIQDPRVFIPVLLGPAATCWGLARLREKRQIQNTPKSKVRSAAMGMVAISGKSQMWQSITDPIGGLPCCWWKCLVEEYRQEGKNSRWVLIKELMFPEPFYLEDETGKLLVDPLQAEIYCDQDTFPLDSSTRDRLEPVLFSWGLTDTGFFGTLKQMRIRQMIIYPDSPLFVFGELTQWKNPQENQKAEFLARLQAIKKDQAKLAEAGVLGKDGSIDIQAWDAFCRKQEEEFFRGSAVQESAAPECDKLVIRKPSDQSMIIDTRPEEDLLKKLDNQAFWGTFGGISLSAFGIWLSLKAGFSYNTTAIVILISIAAGIIIGNRVKSGSGVKLWTWSS